MGTDEEGDQWGSEEEEGEGEAEGEEEVASRGRGRTREARGEEATEDLEPSPDDSILIFSSPLFPLPPRFFFFSLSFIFLFLFFLMKYSANTSKAKELAESICKSRPFTRRREEERGVESNASGQVSKQVCNFFSSFSFIIVFLIVC